MYTLILSARLTQQKGIPKLLRRTLIKRAPSTAESLDHIIRENTMGSGWDTTETVSTWGGEVYVEVTVTVAVIVDGDITAK